MTDGLELPVFIIYRVILNDPKTIFPKSKKKKINMPIKNE